MLVSLSFSALLLIATGCRSQGSGLIKTTVRPEKNTSSKPKSKGTGLTWTPLAGPQNFVTNTAPIKVVPAHPAVAESRESKKQSTAETKPIAKISSKPVPKKMRPPRVALRSIFLGGTSRNAPETYSIKENSDNGTILILSDGSVWEVASNDRYDSMYWLMHDDVIVIEGTPVLLVNDDEIVEAVQLKPGSGNYANADLALRENADRGKIIVLSDDTIWEASYSDRYDARNWDKRDPILVIRDQEKLVNLEKREVIEVKRIRSSKIDIKEVTKDGTLIILEDGTIWEVERYDRYDSKYWRDYDTIFLLKGISTRLLNGDEIIEVRAR